MYGFLSRHPRLAVRRAEGLSYARARGLNRDDVNVFYDRLEKVLSDHGILSNPESIYNADETGQKLIYKPGKVVIVKGKSSVLSQTQKKVKPSQ